jgi:hypothetical protein
VGEEELLGMLRRDDQASQCGARHDVGGGRLRQQDGDLAEEAAGRELRPLLIVDDDAHLAVDDDEYAGGLPSLPKHPAALGERSLFQLAGERMKFGLGKVGENAEVSQPGRDMVGHGSKLPG